MARVRAGAEVRGAEEGNPDHPLDHAEVEGGYANGDDDGFTPHPLTAEQAGEIATSIEKRYPVCGLVILFWRTPVFARRSWPGWKSVT